MFVIFFCELIDKNNKKCAFKKPLYPASKLEYLEFSIKCEKILKFLTWKITTKNTPTFECADKNNLERKMRLYAIGLVEKVYYSSAITNINKPGKKMQNEFKIKKQSQQM